MPYFWLFNTYKTAFMSITIESVKESSVFKNANGKPNWDLICGISAGLIGIFGYGFYNGKIGWDFVFLSFLMAAACYMSGFFLGILFGIPKRQNHDHAAEYVLNNNLADISDWLTKIIIGVGLVEMKKIPVYLGAAGDFVKNAIDPNHGSLKLFAVCTIVYFSVFGLYYGYCYMRLYLSGQIKKADDGMLKLKEAGEKLVNEISEKNLTPSDPNKAHTVDKETKEKFSEFNQQLKSAKKEEEYTFIDWYLKGIDAYNKMEYEKTISHMQSALAKPSKSKNKQADAYIYMGIAYGNLKLFDKALENFDKVINEYRSYRNLNIAYYDRGWALNNLQRYEEGLEAHNRSIELNSDYENAWFGKSFSLGSLNRTEEALEAIEQAISLNHSDVGAWSNKGMYLNDLKRFKEGLIASNRALELDANYKFAWNNKTVSLINLDNNTEALAAANRVVELDPFYPNGYYNRACCYAKLGQPEKAIADLKEAFKLEPNLKKHIDNDTSFDAIREDEEFKKLLE